MRPLPITRVYAIRHTTRDRHVQVGHARLVVRSNSTTRDKRSVSGARTLRAGPQSVQALSGRARFNTVGEENNSRRRYSRYAIHHDTPELWRGAAGLCACAGAAESLHTYIHTILVVAISCKGQPVAVDASGSSRCRASWTPVFTC